ncbi:RING/U-box superfamily protein [Striga asiatica]|uniref:RING/U-box superfamily protein n=1 Tax=Striga asiatica TaxID=4170 RepID=A0A5A7PVS0_STRAF|nr:RING/U-box superfamily protein [Striga asiatica]
MDEELRKRTRTTMLDQLEEERTSPVLETIESESDEAAGTTTSDESDEELEFSDEEFFYGGVQFGVELSEDTEYDDFDFYQDMEEDEVDPDELSYEELLALGEMVGVENTGLPKAEITKHLHPLTCQSTSNLIIDRCVICQVEYEQEEELAGLQCEHLYHKDCIVKWLQIKKMYRNIQNLYVSKNTFQDVPRQKKGAKKNGESRQYDLFKQNAQRLNAHKREKTATRKLPTDSDVFEIDGPRKLADLKLREKKRKKKEMRMLRWFCGNTRRDRIHNEDIRDRVGVAPIEEKLVQHRLRWFGHVQRRPLDAPVRRGVLQRVEDVKRGRGRPKLTWEESVKRDLKDWNISKDLAVHRSAWRLAINVPEP